MIKINLRPELFELFQCDKHVVSSRLRSFVGHRTSLVTLFTTALFLSTACKKEASESRPVTEQVTPTSQQQRPSAEKAATASQTPPKMPPISTPSGPEQVILPGKGLTSIRFGATRETIERHMQASCQYADAKRCIYLDNGLEFFIDDGGLEKVSVHIYNDDSNDVPGAKRNYGSFNGVLPIDIRPGLHRHIVISEYGEPLRIEKPKVSTHFGLQEMHYYDGIVLEYDRIQNGNVVLARLEVFPSKTALDPIQRFEKLKQKNLQKQKKSP